MKLNQHYALKLLPPERKRIGRYFTCETCAREFYVFPSYIRKATSNGWKIRFCTMKCYSKTGSRNPFYGRRHGAQTRERIRKSESRHSFVSGRTNPNSSRFDPRYFRGRSKEWWRRFLISTLSGCERCGFNTEIRILQIHHLDRDTTHNTRRNLKLLCPNCHEITHLKCKDGRHRKTPAEHLRQVRARGGIRSEFRSLRVRGK